MKFIEESTIDKITENIGGEESNYQTALDDFHKEQPIFLGFLFSENFNTLFEKEREFLLFLVVVIYEASKEGTGDAPMEIDEDAIEIAEEKNWEIIGNSSAKIFRERIDPFFENYPQEDLLAFVEDALADDEEAEFITKESREAIFITAKTLIDCLHSII